MSGNQYILRQWPASYYIPDNKNWLSKRWISGTFVLTAKGVRFTETSKKKDECIKVEIRFNDFSELKKTTVLIVYSAVVISTKDTVHWFSAFPNRDVVFTIVEHFWKEKLVPHVKSHRNKCKSDERTVLGTELLRLTQDSEQTLQEAATQLEHQGEQLDNAMGLMYDLHGDLEIAEKLISGFESWVFSWRLPKVYTPEEIIIIDSKNIPTVYDFPVLYRSETSTIENFQNGILRLSKEGINIMDHQQINVHYYSKKDVSSIKAISPWEIVISRFLIGQPDVSFTLISTHMIQILKALEPIYRDKFDLIEIPYTMNNVSPTEQSSRASSICTDASEISPPATAQPLEVNTPLFVVHPEDNLHGGSQIQTQTTKIEGVISEAEAEELSEMVARMKNVALSVSQEEDAQMEKIDKLTESVDEANVRLKQDATRIQKLI